MKFLESQDHSPPSKGGNLKAPFSSSPIALRFRFRVHKRFFLTLRSGLSARASGTGVFVKIQFPRLRTAAYFFSRAVFPVEDSTVLSPDPWYRIPESVGEIEALRPLPSDLCAFLGVFPVSALPKRSFFLVMITRWEPPPLVHLVLKLLAAFKRRQRFSHSLLPSNTLRFIVTTVWMLHIFFFLLILHSSGIRIPLYRSMPDFSIHRPPRRICKALSVSKQPIYLFPSPPL